MPPSTPRTWPLIHELSSKRSPAWAKSATWPTRFRGWRSAAAAARASLPSILFARGVSVMDGAGLPNCVGAVYKLQVELWKRPGVCAGR